jgi:putative SOS response-associated peptidase YedK
VRVPDLSVPGNLSRVSWKLSRTVLRGGTNSNVGPLLDDKIRSTKQPYCFEVNRGGLFSFAGLWERWNDSSGKTLATCSILTTTANALTVRIHDRVPVVLDPQCYDLWLDPRIMDPIVVSEFLKPFDARLMRCFPVSSRVNRPGNDDPECSTPVGITQPSRQSLLVGDV